MSDDVAVRGSQVAPGVVSSATALEIEDGLSFNEWRRLGDRFEVVLERSLWTVGDWRRYGDRWDHAGEGGYADAIAAIDRSDETIRVCAWVARAFEPGRRRGKLKFRHHQLVAKLPPEDQDRWLLEAERHGWKTRELEERLAEGAISGARPAALSLRPASDVAARFEARALALGVPAKDLALEVLDLASQLDDPVAALKAAGARREIEAAA